MTLPYSHGMEVEQDPNQAPDEVVYGDGWHRDGSGPQETDYGAYKQVKSILNRFKDDCNGRTWTWHNEMTNGGGCGSHVHLHLSEDFCSEFSERTNLEAWTVSWNSIVEIAPFLLPMFTADWENGYRSSVTRWASPNITRYSQSSVASRVENPRSTSRGYDSVTFNGASHSGKPLTIELRFNEAHPSQALVGLLFLRRIAGNCVEEGWSPKLAGDRRALLNEVYEACYSPGHQDVFEALDDVGPVRFQEGRGIPGLDCDEFDSALDLFQAILGSMSTDTGNYKDRMKALTLARSKGDTDLNQEDFNDELWTIDEDSRFWSQVDDRQLALH